MEKMYHIGIDDSHGAKYVILPGDPGRVEKIASYLDDARFLGQNREYTSYIGTLAGEKVLVMSSGMGGPSMAIGLEELYQTGIRTAIRIGTCGGIALPVTGGDLVIANAAIRMEGTTREYVPIEFPAVSNIEVTNALIESAKRLEAKYHVGVVHCKDSFFGQHDPDRMPIGYELNNKWEAWKKANTLGSEMESAALFVVSQVLGIRAGCVLNVVWNKDREKLGMSNPESHDTTLAVRSAVEAIRVLIETDRENDR